MKKYNKIDKKFRVQKEKKQFINSHNIMNHLHRITDIKN